MSAAASYLAIDLGASGGRALLVSFDGQRLAVQPVHRFDNGPRFDGDGLFWDASRLFQEIKTALEACRAAGARLRAIGIDTWGVDFALLGADGALVGPPRHYRDPRNGPAMAAALRRVGRARIYEATGLQFMPLNTLYQLCAAAADPQRPLDHARRLLFMPDLFNYWLTGVAQTERTIASTSQMVSARSGDWDHGLLDDLGIRSDILPPIRPTATVCGSLDARIASAVGQVDVPVVHTASHDTASAVAAVPAGGSRWAYISSGTWSLVGVELPAPLISPQSLAADFTNEAGAGGTTRFLKNVAGLWLLQECRRCWAEAGRTYSFADLARLAQSAAPLRSLVDPDDPSFATPGEMPRRICDASRAAGEPEPADVAGLVRCLLESLALRYDQVLRSAAALTGRTIEAVHVVGGGSQNELLNELIAAATGCLVIAGPAEATALGNAAVQAIALGDLPDVDAARRIVAASVPLRRYEPPADAALRRQWSEARQRFAGLGRPGGG